MATLPPSDLSFQSRAKELHGLRKFLAEELERRGLEKRHWNLVTLAVDEAVANVVEHAYGEDATRAGPVWVRVESDEEMIHFVVQDEGIPFDPLSVAAVNITAHVDARKKDGLGVMMIRKIMDDVSYVYADQKNCLRMSKRDR